MVENQNLSHLNWKLNNTDIDVHFSVDLESCQTSKIKLFVKKFHGFKPLTIYAKSCILNVWGDPKYVSVNNQSKKLKHLKNGK